jgi:hypothetical protein
VHPLVFMRRTRAWPRWVPFILCLATGLAMTGCDAEPSLRDTSDAGAVGSDAALGSQRDTAPQEASRSDVAGLLKLSSCDGPNPDFLCAAAASGGCSGHGVQAVCLDGAWTCPAGTIPTSECGCLAPACPD